MMASCYVAGTKHFLRKTFAVKLYNDVQQLQVEDRATTIGETKLKYIRARPLSSVRLCTLPYVT